MLTISDAQGKTIGRWHTGEMSQLRTFRIENVERVTADGDELEYIIQNLVNVPYSKTQRVQDWRGDITTFLYWDCECDKDYIHPKTQDYCEVCIAFKEDMPDSRTTEVIDAGLPL